MACKSKCDPNNEPIASALNNFQTAFFGTLTKTCVNGKVVWTLPCDLETGISGFPRLANEGIACYLLRIFAEGNTNTGYTINTITGDDYTLVVNDNTIDQEWRGTLTDNVNINIDDDNAVAGNKFENYFNNIVLGAFTLTIQSNGTTIKTFTGPGTLSGFLEATWTGSEWAPTKSVTDVV